MKTIPLFRTVGIVRSLVFAATLLALNGAWGAVDTSAFPYSMGITFSGYTSGSALINFPALIVFDHALENFSYSQFLAAVDGGDLRFTDENKTAWLNYEIETWSPSPNVALAAPTNIAGCVMWLRAETGVQTNETGGVTNWVDSSGSGNSAAQSDAARLPLFTANAFGGHPAVSFDGVEEPNGDRLTFADTAVQTVFIVNRVGSGMAWGGGIFGQVDADMSLRRSNPLKWQFPGNENDFSSPAGSLFTVNGLRTSSVGENTWHALMAQRSTMPQTCNAIGGGYYQSRSFKGDIAEVIAFNRPLSSTERAQVNDYLYRKYGLGEVPGRSCVWVQVPELRPLTRIVACWGNANATPPACTTNGATWNSTYVGVWHAFSPTNYALLPDSTAGQFGGANNSATAVAGLIGNAMSFNMDLAANVDLPTTCLSSVANAITVSLWQYGSARQPVNACVFEAKNSDGQRVLGSHVPWADSMRVYWDAGWAAGYSQPFDRVENPVSSSSDYKGQWNNWVYVKDATAGTMSIYLNGELWCAGTGGLTRPITGATAFRLGSGVDWGYYDGIVDEFRVSNAALSPDWIRASYQNQAPNSRFCAYEPVVATHVVTKPFRCSMRIGFTGYTGMDTLRQFPALVVFSNGIPGFAFSQFLNAGGGDLRFTDADQTTWLNYEIERWPAQGSSDPAYVWVQIPKLEGTNTAVWAFWDNGSAVRPAYATNGATWAQNFAAVWHALSPTNASELPDSAPGRHPGSASGVGDAPGLIGNALSFSGATVSVPPAALDSVTNEITISLWQYGTVHDAWCSAFEGVSNGLRVLNAHIPWGSLIFWDAGIDVNDTFQPFDRYYKECTSANQWCGQWNHWVFTKNAASGVQNIYLNGAYWGGRTGAIRPMVGITAFNIGSGVGWGYYNGLIDEFRIQNVAQTPDWIQATYLNQKAGSTFATYGAVNKQFFGTLLIFR